MNLWQQGFRKLFTHVYYAEIRNKNVQSLRWSFIERGTHLIIIHWRFCQCGSSYVKAFSVPLSPPISTPLVSVFTLPLLCFVYFLSLGLCTISLFSMMLVYLPYSTCYVLKGILFLPMHITISLLWPSFTAVFLLPTLPKFLISDFISASSFHCHLFF